MFTVDGYINILKQKAIINAAYFIAISTNRISIDVLSDVYVHKDSSARDVNRWHGSGFNFN